MATAGSAAGAWAGSWKASGVSPLRTARQGVKISDVFIAPAHGAHPLTPPWGQEFVLPPILSRDGCMF